MGNNLRRFLGSGDYSFYSRDSNRPPRNDGRSFRSNEPTKPDAHKCAFIVLRGEGLRLLRGPFPTHSVELSSRVVCLNTGSQRKRGIIGATTPNPHTCAVSSYPAPRTQ